MSAYIGIALALLAFWVLMNFKTSRPDGKLVKVHPFRRMLSFLMQSPNASIVYFDDYVPADNLLEFLEKSKKAGKDADVTACVVAALAIGIDEAPKLNRFLTGHRLYQRNVRKISFSALRRQMDKSAKTSAVHVTMDDTWTFDDLLDAINSKISIERSGEETYTDKELNLFLRLPRPLLRIGIWLLKWLDYHNLLPASFIDNDPLYCSIFMANLGSIGMKPGYHHLYDWGNCPLFAVVGEMGEMPIAENGKVVARNMLHIRYSFDERIDDGINANDGILAARAVLEDPFTWLGCLKEDRSDRPALVGKRRA